MNVPNPSSDLLLARLAASGRADAWETLLTLYGERVYNLAFHFAGSAADAEDLTQEVFLRLYQNLRLYRGDVPLAAWALRLSRNLCIDHYRRARRERRAAAVSEEVLAQLPAQGDDPQAEAQRRQQLRTVYRELEAMPEDLAEVVLLRDLQGWSQEETAAWLEVPVGTVKSRLHRARLELAERVAARLVTRTAPAADRGPGGGVMLSWSCRRFRARFSPSGPGSAHPHRRACPDCDAYRRRPGERGRGPPPAAGEPAAKPAGDRRSGDGSRAAVRRAPAAGAGRPRRPPARSFGGGSAQPPGAPRVGAQPALRRRRERPAGAAARAVPLRAPRVRARRPWAPSRREVSPLLHRTEESGRKEIGKLRSTAADACDAARRSVEGSLERLDHRLAGLSVKLSEVVPERFINLDSRAKPAESVRRPQ